MLQTFSDLEKQQCQERILRAIDLSREVSDAEIYEIIDEEICLTPGFRGYSAEARTELREELFHRIRGLDILEDLLADEEITEIMINSSREIFVERTVNRRSRVERWDGHFSSPEKLEDVIQQIVSACNRVVNVSRPIADARLSDGARVNIVLPPVSLGGPAVTIRRFPKEKIRMSDLISYGSVTEEAAAFLEKLVQAKYNIFVSGGTGTGKTTFLNALSDFIPEKERIITIEDNAELQITHLPNLVRLEARNANVEGKSAIEIRDLIKTSLRMRPDRIIVGEVRGGEAIDMLQAMNTGHDGSMSTGHGNSTKDMLRRLETMVFMSGMELPLPAIRGQIAAGIDILIHLGRLPGGERKVLAVEELVGSEGEGYRLNRVFALDRQEDGGSGASLTRCGSLCGTDKLAAAGLKEVI